MITIDSLRAFGADVDTGLERCLNNPEFYIKIVNLALADQRFEDLKQVLEQKNYDKAFEMCHALKGTTGNVALDPMYKIICQMTELLRSRTDADYLSMYNQVVEFRNQLLK